MVGGGTFELGASVAFIHDRIRARFEDGDELRFVGVRRCPGHQRRSPERGAEKDRNQYQLSHGVEQFGNQVFQGARLAMDNMRFASWSSGNISACGSHVSGRRSCLTTPPSNTALTE